jgi:hypothetical protein
MKSGKARNGVDTLLYEYTVIIALICARQLNVPFDPQTFVESDAW